MAIPNLVAMISGKDGDSYQDSQIYNSIKGYYPDDENLANSFALRLLIHYVGDVHQPLHCMDRFDKEHVDGDKGANDFPLPNHREVKELHALWDKILWAGYPDEERPFTDETFAAFQTKTEELMAHNSRHKPTKLYAIG